MKTAISIPDPIFAQAEQLAARMKISRSKLYVIALQKLLQEHHQEHITDQINDYIRDHGQPIDEVFVNSGLRELRQIEW
ncbi:MAG: ChpI protein [Planctomycetota bacterium]|nr:MAG: ChpI protein [Planctomycetota bacterium]